MRRAIIFGSLVLCFSVALLAQGPPGGARGPRVGIGQGQRNGQRHAGPHMGDWLRQHQSQTPEQQQKVQDRLKRFDNLPPEQKQRILNRLDLMGHLTPEQRSKVISAGQEFRNLPQERKQALRQGFRSLQGLTPEEQQKMIDSPAFQNQFSEHERDILRTIAPLRLPPAEVTPEAQHEPL